MPPSVKLILEEQGQIPDKLGSEIGFTTFASTVVEPASPDSDYYEDLFPHTMQDSPIKLTYNFSPAPIYCISFLCIGDLLGYGNSTSTEPSPTTVAEKVSIVTPTVHALVAPELEIKAANGQNNFEDLVRAALYFFSSLPGALLLFFMTLGKLVFFEYYLFKETVPRIYYIYGSRKQQ